MGSSMGRVGLSFKAFWKVLRDDAFADAVRRLVERAKLPEPSPAAATPAPVGHGAVAYPTPAPVAPARSEALTLLSVLQREARLVDFLKEDIAGYANDQIGAAVRDIHRDAAGVLSRLFDLKPVMTEAEGSSVAVPAGTDAARVRLVGNVAGSPPFRGTLRHGGWEATRVELPSWTGAEASAKVVAPAEVEV